MVMRDLNIGTKVGLALLNDRWSALTLSNLTATPMDFMTLRQRVRGLSTLKLLTVLAKLNEFGLVTESAPYQYQLTGSGLALQRSLQTLESWGDQMIVTLHS
ncbi:winged helix-turn-helix transcriptional regulator [Lactiplantibacillus carotarum]|uniref:winged helix-turn-helix transcriptional regulator n=1 Tax=Lactiplantibacillus carotarum TaxID=2993456 RepID=UPI00298F349E|nr:winged helix-turn-helix transcriptional regulator [Lactiplantibacillus carotarum]